MNTNQVSQPQTPTTPTLPPTTNTLPQPTPKKKTPWLLISFTILLLSATGVLGYQNYQLKKQLDNLSQPTLPSSPQLVVSSPSPVSSPTAEVDPTAGWGVYKNDKYDFSFQHPNLDSDCCSLSGPVINTAENLVTLAELDTAAQGTDMGFNGFAVYIDKTPINLGQLEGFENYMYGQRTSLVGNYKEFTGNEIKNNTEKSFNIKEKSGKILENHTWWGADLIYIPLNNSEVLVLSVLEKSEGSFQQTFSQILSTFKFTN